MATTGPTDAERAWDASCTSLDAWEREAQRHTAGERLPACTSCGGPRNLDAGDFSGDVCDACAEDDVPVCAWCGEVVPDGFSAPAPFCSLESEAEAQLDDALAAGRSAPPGEEDA